MSAIVQINKAAKALQAKNKRLAWQDAIQQASAAYRKKAGTGKKKPAKKAAKKVVKRVSRKAPVKKTTVVKRVVMNKSTPKKRAKVSPKKTIINDLETELQGLFIRKENATKVRDKRKITKRMSEVRAKLRNAKKL